MSLGGEGCWHLSAERSELFAAALPICGSGSALDLATRLVALPRRAFHESDNWVIPMARSRDLDATIREASRQWCRYAEYPASGTAAGIGP